jgi:hypothetical protein
MSERTDTKLRETKFFFQNLVVVRHGIREMKRMQPAARRAAASPNIVAVPFLPQST